MDGSFETESIDEIYAVARLSKDLREASRTLSVDQARYLVDAYYIAQKDRMRCDAQVRQLVAADEPCDVLKWLATNNRTIEDQIKASLDKFSLSHPVGEWARSIVGVGPVIAAGLIAHIDVTRAKTAGAVWRYAGLDPTQKWNGRDYMRGAVAQARKDHDGDDWSAFVSLCRDLNRRPSNVLMAAGQIAAEPSAEDAAKVCATLTGVKARPKATIYADNVIGELCPEPARGFEALIGEWVFDWSEITASLSKRPWNAQLKNLAWKVGESFCKVSGNPDAFYGQVYARRKQLEIERNEAGQFADQAAHSLKTKNYGRSTDAYKWYKDGKLPPARIHLRATRYAVKLFLAHYHEVAYVKAYGEKPPAPYPIAILGHAHYIAPPGEAA